MKTIWKFPIETMDRQALPLPRGARILAVQVQHGQPCIWAIVDPKADKETVEIRIHGTGHGLSEDSHTYDYIGTYQLRDGELVFHVFRVMGVGEMLGKAFRL